MRLSMYFLSKKRIGPRAVVVCAGLVGPLATGAAAQAHRQPCSLVRTACQSDSSVQLPPPPAGWSISAEYQLAEPLPELAGALPGRASDCYNHGIGNMVLSGLILGAAGAGAGWVLGSKLSDSEEGGLAVGALGESIGMSLGVHLSSPSSGRTGTTIAATTGLAAVAFAVVLLQRSDAALQIGSIVLPLVQLPVAIAIARVQ